MDNQPARRSTPLSGSTYCAKQRCTDREIEVRVFSDDYRIVATQFQQHLTQTRGYRSGHSFAHSRGTRRRDERDPRILCKQFSHTIITVDAAGHTFRNVVFTEDFADDLLACNTAQGRFLRWLPHACVAAYPRDHGVPRPHSNGKIERGNYAYRTQGMPLFIHAMMRPLRMHSESVQLTRQAYGEIADVDHLLDFPETFLKGLAHLIRYKHPQRLLATAQCLTNLPYNFPSSGCRPHTPLKKSLGCHRKDAINGRSVSRLYSACYFSIDRRHGRQRWSL